LLCSGPSTSTPYTLPRYNNQLVNSNTYGSDHHCRDLHEPTAHYRLIR
jgi:hypothetical protein